MTNPYNLLGWNKLLVDKLSNEIKKALENKEIKVKMNSFAFNLTTAISFCDKFNQNLSDQEECN
jgi:hypothetical protein